MWTGTEIFTVVRTQHQTFTISLYVCLCVLVRARACTCAVESICEVTSSPAESTWGMILSHAQNVLLLVNLHVSRQSPSSVRNIGDRSAA